MQLQCFFFSVLLTAILIGCGPQDPSEKTDFLRAVRSDQVDSLALFLAADPALLHRPTQEEALTPLHVAARHAEPKTIRWLIEQGADPNAQDREGETPLHAAIDALGIQGTDRVWMLLEAGADPAIANHRGLDVWESLMDQGPTRIRPSTATAMAFLLRHGYQPEMRMQEQGKHLLHELSQRCPSSEVIELLLTEQGLDPDVRDANGWTPLHWAAVGQNYPAAEVLLRHGADVDAASTQGVGRRGPYEAGAEGDRPEGFKYPPGTKPEDLLYYRSHRGRRTKSLHPLFEAYQ